MNGVGDATLGAKLRAWRVARGIGLRELARHLDVGATYLSFVERGHTRPSANVLDGMLSECQVSQAEADQIWVGFGLIPRDVQQLLKDYPVESFQLLRKNLNGGDDEAVISKTGESQRKGA